MSQRSRAAPFAQPYTLVGGGQCTLDVTWRWSSRVNIPSHENRIRRTRDEEKSRPTRNTMLVRHIISGDSSLPFGVLACLPGSHSCGRSSVPHARAARMVWWASTSSLVGIAYCAPRRYHFKRWLPPAYCFDFFTCSGEAPAIGTLKSSFSSSSESSSSSPASNSEE